VRDAGRAGLHVAVRRITCYSVGHAGEIRVMAEERKKPLRVLKEVPLPVKPAFKREFIDFERGIRMGGLEPEERITQIVKHALVARHRRDFLIDKWGRGRYWQWICWLVRDDREAKPLSNTYSFGCVKFFVSYDNKPDVFQAGMQLERATVSRGRAPAGEIRLQKDWDWHRFLAGLKKGSALEARLHRLVAGEGFTAHLGGSEAGGAFRGRDWGGAAAIRRAVRRVPDDAWAWFQLYWAWPEEELREMDGGEIIASVLAVFGEVAPVMNLLMEEPYLAEPGPGPGRARR
jgi:hypothetical protein